MLITRGAPALSDFRLQKLIMTLQQQIPAIRGITAEFVHFSDVKQPLTDDQQQVLERLLQYGPSAEHVEGKGQLFVVVPRPGTISPWSSKATDIAHNAGLTDIDRIERGVAYYIDSE